MYKRQFLGWLPLNGTDLVEGTVIVFALAALAFIRPVSYTHLDVYKRQVQSW